MPITLDAVSAMPSQLASGCSPVTSLCTASKATYGASRKNWIATSFWARCSAASESRRAPVKRQTMIALAKPSIAESMPKPIERDRAGEDAGDDRDRALGAHPDEAEPGEQLDPPDGVEVLGARGGPASGRRGRGGHRQLHAHAAGLLRDEHRVEEQAAGRRQREEDDPPVTPRADQAGIAEHLYVVRDQRLRPPRDPGQITPAELLAGPERLRDREARRLAERLSASDRRCGRASVEFPADALRERQVQAEQVALIGHDHDCTPIETLPRGRRALQRPDSSHLGTASGSDFHPWHMGRHRLANGRISVRDAKTAAGERLVDILPALRDELASHRHAAGAGASPTRSSSRPRAAAAATRTTPASASSGRSSPPPTSCSPRAASRPCPPASPPTSCATRSPRSSTSAARIRPT